MVSVKDRFLKYVSYDTQSDESSVTCPSTLGQKILGRALVEEMKDMGIADARMDENGYVYGTVPGDPDLPTIGLIAHMDTSPDASGSFVDAKVVEYTGADICLNEDKGIVLSAKDYPNLKPDREYLLYMITEESKVKPNLDIEELKRTYAPKLKEGAPFFVNL
jgi:tripeptide aminopeptidase